MNGVPVLLRDVWLPRGSRSFLRRNYYNSFLGGKELPPDWVRFRPTQHPDSKQELLLPVQATSNGRSGVC